MYANAKKKIMLNPKKKKKSAARHSILFSVALSFNFVSCDCAKVKAFCETLCLWLRTVEVGRRYLKER